MTQPTLFDAPPYGGVAPFVKGSDTSEAASQSLEPTAKTKRRVVLTLIEVTGTTGATDDELERLTGWRHQTVSARRRELVLQGLVKDSGKRRDTSSGRSAAVWEAV